MRARMRAEGGFTMIEVLVAVLLLSVGVIGTFEVFDSANAATGRTSAREGGTNLAREVVEVARGVPYAKVLDGSVDVELQREPSLADAAARGGWQIRRRGVTYDVSVSVCLVDDDKDGLGAHDNQAFCGAAAGTSDLNPDDYRRVRVDVSWDAVNTSGRLRQSALIVNPGTGSGPAIRSLTMTNPASSPIITNTGNVQFDLTTATPAAAVRWSVDGAYQGNANGSGTAWDFHWPIAQLYDGTYLVSGQAFDEHGGAGAARVYTVALNRNAPRAPTGFAGGRNGTAAEFEWLPNAEGDIEGYRLYRRDASGDTVICPLQKETTCTDPSPPAGSRIDYYVVAVDRDPNGNLRQGARSTKAVVDTNQPPNPPTNVTARTDQYGHIVLSWAEASPDDPDSNDSIDFYRIYRDGEAVADRYDRTGTGELSFIDNRPGAGPHTYWVSAVDTHYAESTLTGPVAP